MNKYFILGSNFHNAKLYKSFFEEQTANAKTNRDIIHIYNCEYSNLINSDADIILVQELTETFIELNKTSTYAIFAKEDNCFRLLEYVRTEDEYNSFCSSYSGDLSKCVILEIILDKTRGIK